MHLFARRLTARHRTVGYAGWRVERIRLRHNGRMTLDRHPFIDAALIDVTDQRTMPQRLTTPSAAAATPISIGHDDIYTVTPTFAGLWDNLPATADIATMIAVMRGVGIEPRHPAYRVTATGYPNVYQAKCGDDTALVFTLVDDQTVWLAVLREP